MFKRAILSVLAGRLSERRRFLQFVVGPRQTGKTTLANQLIDDLSMPSHYVSADAPALRDARWLEYQWEIARRSSRAAGPGGALLVLDEVQRIPDWSEAVKLFWDEDTKDRLNLKVVVMMSLPPLLQDHPTESLAGRFELIHVTHWSYPEMRAAFGWDLDHYVYFGGYPGAAGLIEDEARWRQFVADSLIETTLSRDLLPMPRVDKPALLRRLLHLGCEHSGQILSYQKMNGQLQDAGSTTTLTHYLDLLAAAGFVAGLQKFSGQRNRQRSSSPKLQVLNTALMSAAGGRSLVEARQDFEYWGRLVESAIGAHLVNATRGTDWQVSYWMDRSREVDFVVHRGRRAIALEVKSGRRRASLPGAGAFRQAFGASRMLLIGSDGIPVEEFLRAPLSEWIDPEAAKA